MQTFRNYEDIRKECLSVVEDVRKNGVDSPNYRKFRNDTKELISIAVTNLLTNTNSDMKFYGYFTTEGNRSASWVINRPIHHQIRSNGITFLYNPLLIVDYNVEEISIMIAKEVVHLVAKHYLLQVELRDVHPWMITKLACELEASDIMEDSGLKLIDQLWTRRKINEKFDCDIKKATAKEIAHELHNLLYNNELFKEWIENTMDDAKFMEDGDDPLLIGDVLRTVVRIVIGEKTRGNKPAGLAGYVDLILAPPVVTWQQEIARFIGSLPSGKKPSMFRRNRRQPNRIDLKGKLSDKSVDLVVAIDTSASVSDKEVAEFMRELFGILKSVKHDVTIIECDAEIGRIYQAKQASDVQQEITGRGGTYFTPVFEWIQENKTKDTVLVYLTDGGGEYEMEKEIFDNINHQGTIWVLSGRKDDLSLKGSNLPLRSKILSLTNK